MEQYAIVTGATKGIGKAIVDQLLSKGVHTFFCARTQSDIDDLIASFQQMYPNVKVWGQSVDMEDMLQVQSFIEFIKQRVPYINLLVNNAGIFIADDLLAIDVDITQKMLSINVLSAMEITKGILPVMQAGNRHIFNICSIAGLGAYPNGPSYSISKYALLGFNDNLRVALKTKNIKVTAICPGPTNSFSWEGSGVDAEKLMQAEDIAQVLWSHFNLSPVANVDRIVLNPLQDL